MTPPDLSAPFTPEALEALGAREGYDQAVDAVASGSLRAFAEADETGRWLFRDLGRSALYLAALALDVREEGLTASALARVAADNHLASRGRVMAFLRRVESAGEIAVPPGDQPWTQRRLVLRARFIDRFRDGNVAYARAAALTAPEISEIVPRLYEPDFFRRFVLGVGIASQVAASIAPPGGEQLFLERDRGMSILFRLMVAQPRPRARLLESGRLSRAALSREFAVSRAHINRLLADAAAAGLLTNPEPDLVLFSPAFSDDVRQMMSVTLQITRLALLMAGSAASDL